MSNGYNNPSDEFPAPKGPRLGRRQVDIFSGKSLSIKDLATLLIVIVPLTTAWNLLDARVKLIEYKVNQQLNDLKDVKEDIKSILSIKRP